jgi:hypothetical protein
MQTPKQQPVSLLHCLEGQSVLREHCVCVPQFAITGTTH